MSKNESDSLLSRLGGDIDAEWDAIGILKKKWGEGLAPLLAQKYDESSKAAARAACVYHSMGFAARKSPIAIALGIRALKDRSKNVRYRACMLLSYAQDKSALPALREAAATPGPSQEDFIAAIDAIENENQHYFVDRDHSGMITMSIETLD